MPGLSMLIILWPGIFSCQLRLRYDNERDKIFIVICLVIIYKKWYLERRRILKTLIKNALVILPQENEKADIYIDGDSICAIGAAPQGFNAERVIDATDKLLVPGFVNAHTHIYMTAMRNRADDLNFSQWLFDTVIPMESLLTPDDAYWSIQLGCMEMLESGVTSILDMHMFPKTTAKALADSGMRAVISRGLQGDKDNKEAGERRIAEAVEDIELFSHIQTLSFMLAPHAPYSCDEEYLCRVAEKAAELKVGINTHLSESMDEQRTIRARYNMTPAELYDKCGILNDNTVCAHCVYLSESDMVLLKQRGSSVAHNPASNMKLGNGFAPIPLMMEHGLNVCIGTDGCCSNNNQSILREMGITSLIHKGTAREATTMNASKVFDMATVNGAKALGLSDITGEIAVGKRADLSLFDLSSAGFFPLGDPKAALCYANGGLKAETVLINGELILDKGEFKTIDVERVKYEVRQIVKRLNKE